MFVIGITHKEKAALCPPPQLQMGMPPVEAVIRCGTWLFPNWYKSELPIHMGLVLSSGLAKLHLLSVKMLTILIY